jgi:hypothetical protein
LGSKTDAIYIDIEKSLIKMDNTLNKGELRVKYLT